MIYFHNGNLLNSNCQYICHQVNCQGKMNSGVAKAIREKWPIVYEKYRDWYIGYEAWASAHENAEYKYQPADAMLGSIQIVALYKDYHKTENHQYVINMAAQNGYGYDGRRYTSYDAFWSCLGKIKDTIPKGSSMAFPDHIGCCRGGANWEIILTMITEVLSEDYEVYIYKLEDNENDK